MSSLLTSYRSVLDFAIVNAMFALSTFVAMWTGVLSLASVTFAAVAGFLGAYLQVTVGLPVALVLVIGAVAGAVCAFLVSFPLLRLTSHWVALAAIALVLITRVFVLNLDPLTGGANGRVVLRQTPTWMLLAVLALTCLFLARVRRSRIGIACETVREDAAVAATLGIKPSRVQRFAMVVSGAIGGLAGVMMANVVQYINPDTYSTTVMFMMLAAVVLGGAYHWAGAVVGAAVFTLIPEISRTVAPSVVDDILRGVVIIAIMIFLPRGIVDPGRTWRLPGRRRSTPEPATEAS